MTLSEELSWRGLVNQTTYKDLKQLDNSPITFYWGVDPSADSLHIGNLAVAMMVRIFIKYGHKPVLLIGGATGLIGDPDGKSQERDLISPEEIERNKQAITSQYQQLFEAKDIKIVDNYDWFKGRQYLDFLRDIGKHVPIRQMLGRDFVQTRLQEDGSGISYAEFSYVLIQAYDYLRLYEDHGVTLQVCGSDQWGNSIAGVDLVRRKVGAEVHVLSAPLIVNKTTGKKFGKTEAGAIWLDPSKTTPTQFYQFWINVDDDSVENYLKIYSELNKDQIEQIVQKQTKNPAGRHAQKELARNVTSIVHGADETAAAERVTDYLTGRGSIGEADESVLKIIYKEVPVTRVKIESSIIEALVKTGLASSHTEARRLISSNAISINGQKVDRENFETADFQNGRLLIRRGKAYKDSALVEVG